MSQTCPNGLPLRTRRRHGVAAWAWAFAAAVAGAAPAVAAPLQGRQAVWLHARDGTKVAVGHVAFTPAPDGRVAFRVEIDHAPFKDHFLSMREFKCLDGQGEILCHVPYPYPQPGTVARDDLCIRI